MSTNLNDSLRDPEFSLPRGRNEPCITVTDLKKQYAKDSAYTLNGISFNVRYGTVFGFLGPNGAGKTTTLKILTSLLNPSSGVVRIFGKDLIKKQAEIKRKIGVVSQNPSFEANLTVEKALDLYGLLWGLGNNKVRKDKVKEILSTFELESIKNFKNDELSIGQRRRVQLAREFMHDMELLFLDEPTVGLDPSARRMLLDYIKRHVKSGLTVFFTTHIMEEAEYLCDEIAIIDKGKIIAFDTPTGLRQKYAGGTKTIELEFKDTLTDSFIDLINAAISINNSNNISNSHIDINDGGHSITIKVKNVEQIISKILQVVSESGKQIENISINPPSLEQVFLSIVNNGEAESINN